MLFTFVQIFNSLQAFEAAVKSLAAVQSDLWDGPLLHSTFKSWLHFIYLKLPKICGIQLQCVRLG